MWAHGCVVLVYRFKSQLNYSLPKSCVWSISEIIFETVTGNKLCQHLEIFQKLKFFCSPGTGIWNITKNNVLVLFFFFPLRCFIKLMWLALRPVVLLFISTWLSGQVWIVWVAGEQRPVRFECPLAAHSAVVFVCLRWILLSSCSLRLPLCHAETNRAFRH